MHQPSVYLNEGCKISSKRQKRENGKHFGVVKVQQPSPIKDPTTLVTYWSLELDSKTCITRRQNTKCVPLCELVVVPFEEIIGHSWHNLSAHNMHYNTYTYINWPDVLLFLLHVVPSIYYSTSSLVPIHYWPLGVGFWHKGLELTGLFLLVLVWLWLFLTYQKQG